MTEPNQTQETQPDPGRRSVSVAIILLLIVATVGGTFLYSGTVAGPDPIEMFEKAGSPTVQIEMKAASTVAVRGFSKEMTDPSGKPLFLSDEAGLTSADVKSAGVRQRDDNWVIVVEFTEAGAKKLTQLSRELVVKSRDKATERLAILLDGELNGAPVVLSAIEGGKAQIDLNKLSQAEATKLAKGIVGVE